MTWTSHQLREAFLNFFKKKGHTIVPSSSVLPHNDPSLLFVNSGMVQFKPVFLNQPSKFDGLKRAASVQHCIRAGGKHNDLEDVGHDTYHHTFFEMLGNWSFGDYGKKEAIEMAYVFLTDVLHLDKERMYITYYTPSPHGKAASSDKPLNGGTAEELAEDTETKEIWSAYFPPSRILPFTAENFWEMGDTGPCGPCTEIHYDCAGRADRADRVNKDDPSLIEIWNVVFMQYYRDDDGRLSRLERMCVDTGMGLERVLGILNGTDNYGTDLFLPLFEMTGLANLSEQTGKTTNKEAVHSSDTVNDTVSDQLTNGTVHASNTIDSAVAQRIMADHARTIAVCLHYHVAYASDGAGYVLRRITRRMLRIMHTTSTTASIRMLVTAAADILRLTLTDRQLKMLDDECLLFERTLREGMRYFNQFVQKSGMTAREMVVLKDTYGFPLDMTMQMCRERGIPVDEKEIARLLRENVEKSKAMQGGRLAIKKGWGLGKGETKEWLDKDYEQVEGRVLFVFDEHAVLWQCTDSHEETGEMNEGCMVGVVTDKTPFYAERGGQVGDTGTIFFVKDQETIGTMTVRDTQKQDGYTVHIGTIRGRVCRHAVLSVDNARRAKIRCNHTGTHLLNRVLRKKYGSMQMGSLITDEKLRFDYKMNRKMSIDEIKTIEEDVNEWIRKDEHVRVYLEKTDMVCDAVRLENEHYPDVAQVVDINGYKELCGGLHVRTLGEIRHFMVISEGSISHGVRRIVAVTHDRAIQCMHTAERMLRNETGNACEDGSLGLIDRMRMLSMREKRIKDVIKRRKELVRMYSSSMQTVVVADLPGSRKDVVKDIHAIYHNVCKRGRAIVMARIDSWYVFVCDEGIAKRIETYETRNVVRVKGKVSGEIVVKDMQAFTDHVHLTD